MTRWRADRRNRWVAILFIVLAVLFYSTVLSYSQTTTVPVQLDTGRIWWTPGAVNPDGTNAPTNFFLNCGNTGGAPVSKLVPATQTELLVKDLLVGTTPTGPYWCRVWSRLYDPDIPVTGYYESDPSNEASFSIAPSTYLLTLSVSGIGPWAGVITSTTSGLNCGNGTGQTACSASITAGASVTLTAVPVKPAKFTGWGGACSGIGLTCTVTMNATTTVTAAFRGVGKPPKVVSLNVQ